MLSQFDMTFALPQPEDDPVKFIDALHEAGFDDALLGVGAVGMIGLTFTRDTEIDEAKRAVEKAIPGCKLVRVTVKLQPA